MDNRVYRPSLVAVNKADLIEPDYVETAKKALEKAEEAAQEKMQNTYKDMMPGGGLPGGMDLSKLGL